MINQPLHDQDAKPVAAKPRVLIVDDDAKIRRFLQELLQKHGCDPVVAGSAQDALDLLEGDSIDLTISDIKMPGMDGLELLRQIKSINQSMPVAIMTGLGTAENAITALNRGAYNFITKPFRVQQILKVVRRGLDCREPIRRAAELLPFARNEIRFVIPSRMELVQALSSQLSELANAMGYFLDAKHLEFRLVVDELVTNAIIHGNRSDVAKQVRVHMSIDSERLVLSVEDEGDGFDISTIPDPRDPENLFKTTGRGILLSRLYMDELTYNEIGNHVTAVAYASDLPIVEFSGPSTLNQAVVALRK